MEKELKTIHKWDKLYNTITITLDKSLKCKSDISMPLNYIYDECFDNRYIIRCMGASRGCIDVDSNNVIQSIRIYHDEYKTYRIYHENIDDILKQFIGYKLVIE